MSSQPLLVDTGAWLFALAGDSAYAEALRAARPAIVPGLVLAEVDWHLRAKRREMRRVMNEIGSGAYAYEPPSLADLARAMVIDKKFEDLELGLVDASIASTAERLGIFRLLTIDSDFSAVRVGRSWKRAFELAVPLPPR